MWYTLGLREASSSGGRMSARRQPVEYSEATPEVREIYDDIMATRKTDWVNNFWKVLAHDPVTLRRIWSNIKEVMGAGTIDPLVKEMLYVAVSASNGCRYCIASRPTDGPPRPTAARSLSRIAA